MRWLTENGECRISNNEPQNDEVSFDIRYSAVRFEVHVMASAVKER